MNRNDAIKFLEKQKFRGLTGLQNRFPDYYNFLITTYPNLSLKEAIYQDITNIKPIPCKYGNLPVFHNIKNGYRNYCGSSSICKCKNSHAAKTTKKRHDNMQMSEKNSIIEKMKQTSLEKYGVENYSQTNEYKDKVKQTSLEKYGVENYSQTDEYKDKVKQTSLEKYGVEHHTQTDEYKDKVKQTSLEKYGVEHHTQTDEYKDKVKQTSLEKYGVEFYSQTDEYKEKVKQTNLEKYGVENYFESDDFADKKVNTVSKKYGVKHYTQTEEYKNKFKQQVFNKYGVSHPMKVDTIYEKMVQTNLEKYGVKHYVETHEFKEKLKNHNKEKYGVDQYFESDDFKNKVAQNNKEKYGVPNHTQKNYTEYGKCIFDDIEQFQTDLLNTSVFEMACKINCHVSTIYKFCVIHDLKVPATFRSQQELEISMFLDDHDIQYEVGNKTILDGKELDFYFPDYNFAIEFNGVYWHGETNGGKCRSYHYNKWKECADQNIFLMMIWEDDWKSMKEFWFNKILYMCKKSTKTHIYARNCDFRVINGNTAKSFLTTHHYQGYTSAKYFGGLYYNNELISVMTFANTRNNSKNCIELNRFCNHTDYTVVGGASKLIKNMIKFLDVDIEYIIQFSDNQYSDGNVYATLGFTLDNIIPPDYKYVVNDKRVHKAQFRKSQIKKKFNLTEEDIQKSEWELMKQLGYDRIWDCGKKKWIMKLQKC